MLAFSFNISANSLFSSFLTPPSTMIMSNSGTSSYLVSMSTGENSKSANSITSIKDSWKSAMDKWQPEHPLNHIVPILTLSAIFIPPIYSSASNCCFNGAGPNSLILLTIILTDSENFSPSDAEIQSW